MAVNAGFKIAPMLKTLGIGIAKRLRHREPEAFELLVAVFLNPIYRFLLGRGANSEQAEEMTAETFFQLVRSFPEFKGGDHQVRAFVYATARNVSYGYSRRSRSAFALEDATQDVLDPQMTPLQRMLNDERGQQLTEAIASLPDVVREIVLLKHVEELSIDEISSVCDLPVGTVKSHLYRGRERLKKMLTVQDNSR